jgi:hypothetical protein
MAAVIVLSMPVLFIFFYQMLQGTIVSGCTISYQKAFTYIVKIFADLWLETSVYFAMKISWVIIFVSLIILTFWVLYKENDKTKIIEIIGIIALLIAAVLFFTSAVKFLGDVDYIEFRHIYFIWPLIQFLFVFIITINKNKKYFLFIIPILIHSLILACIFIQPLMSHGEWYELLNFVNVYKEKTDVIFIYPPKNVIPFKYYYTGKRKVVTIPTELNTEKYIIEERILDNNYQERILKNMPGDNEAIIMVENVPEYRCVKYNPDKLLKYLKENFQILDSKDIGLHKIFFIKKMNQ